MVKTESCRHRGGFRGETGAGVVGGGDTLAGPPARDCGETGENVLAAADSSDGTEGVVGAAVDAGCDCGYVGVERAAGADVGAVAAGAAGYG